MIVTDSGGVQKESHFFKKPCIVLRKETEWIELVNNGTAKLVDADPLRIRTEFYKFHRIRLMFLNIRDFMAMAKLLNLY